MRLVHKSEEEIESKPAILEGGRANPYMVGCMKLSIDLSCSVDDLVWGMERYLCLSRE